MDAFEGLVGELEYPMFILTAPGPLGCLVGFTTQASIDPPRFIACLSHKNRTFRDGRRRAGARRPRRARRRRAIWRSSSAARPRTTVDKFARVDWHEGPEGVPILERCENWFVGRVLERLDAGDHDAFLLEPIAGESGDQAEFTFHRAKRIDPGHEA